MQVQYKVSFSDYEKAALAINNNIPTDSKTKIRNSLIICVFFFLILPFASYILRFILTLVFFLLIYYFLFDLWNRFFLKAALHDKAKKKKKEFPKKITLDINEKRFIYTSITEEDEEEFTIPWVKVTAAVETQEMYVLYTSVFSTIYILKKENESTTYSKTFDQTIKGVLNEYYISIQKN